MNTDLLPTPALDVLAIGRSGVDIYPLQRGVGLEDVSTFGKFLGGSPMNVAVAAANLRHSTAIITAVGDDPFGRFVRAQMRALGVYDTYVTTSSTLATPVTFCEIFPPDTFPLYFYREPKAPDLDISPADIPVDAVADAKIFWMTGTGLSDEPSYSAHVTALRARPAGATTILDLDYRSQLWPSADLVQDRLETALAYASVVIGNRDECRVATGEDDSQRAADALLERGAELAIVKQGPAGTLAVTREETVTVPVTPVDVVNGLGAGDAFGGTLCHGLLSGWDLPHVVSAASTAGAIVCSRLECSTAMPTEPEIVATMRTLAPEPIVEKRRNYDEKTKEEER